MDQDYVSVEEARQMLGIAAPTMTRLLRDGVLAWEVNPVDRRGKIIKRTDVLALVAKRPAKMPPRQEAGHAR
jgi:hypothetical protein